MELLLKILAVKRPFNDPCEKQFVQTVIIEPLEKQGHTVIKSGPMENLIVIVPTDSGQVNKVLFSCHTDTVHSVGGANNITADANLGVVYAADKHSCLGADDGTGVWILLKMIEARVPGTYVFHRGEERGCVGSSWMANDKATQEFLKKYDYAVAFDRRDRDDIITHQRSRRCCSEEFAVALAKALNDIEPTFQYKPDPTGIYTDTANYDGLIKECTNLSVGYEGAHTDGEMQDMNHAAKLLEAAKKIDWAALPAKREAKRESYQYEGWGGNSRSTHRGHSGNYGATGRRTSAYGIQSSAGTLIEVLRGIAMHYTTVEARSKLLDYSVDIVRDPPLSMREILSSSMEKGGVESINDYLMAIVKHQPELAMLILRQGLVYYQYYMLTLARDGVKDLGILNYPPLRSSYLLTTFETGQYGIQFDRVKKDPLPSQTQQQSLELVETDPVKAARQARKEAKRKKKEEKRKRRADSRSKPGRYTHGMSAGSLQKLKETENPVDPPKTNVVPLQKTPELSWPSLKNVSQ